MQRPLLFLLLSLMLPACRTLDAPGTANRPAAASIKTTRTITYDISQSITLVNEGPRQPEKHNIWVALITHQDPYQQVLSRQIQPAAYTLITDEYGNQYAEFDLVDMAPGSSAEITINYTVSVNELTYELLSCRGDLPTEFTQAELHIESLNPQIIALADELAASFDTVCEQVRAFYDYIGDNLVYTYNGANWGAQAALGPMGADCTEYSSLLIALSRAKGIPARYREGLLYMDQADSLGARQEHAWVEIYLPGSGWVPMDPTLGRSTLTRENHFAHYSPDHIIVTSGRTPSTLRGASYWTHLYWPGDGTAIRVEEAQWSISRQKPEE